MTWGMGASLPALTRWHACLLGGGELCRYGAAAWVEGEARGGLDKLRRGGRGGAHVSRRHVRFGVAGCAASAAARRAKGRGAAASLLITRFGAGARFVGASLRLPRPRPVGRREDGGPGKRPPRPVGDAAASLFGGVRITTGRDGALKLLHQVVSPMLSGKG